MLPRTTDLYDAHGEDLQVAAPLFNDYGGVTAFVGPISTLKVYEDNALVRTALEEQGLGRVLVIDGAGSTRCALVGGNLAKLALDNGWVGIVVNGCIRDRVEIAALALGIRALNVIPRKSAKKGHGHRDIPLRFANVEFRPGEWLYADEDGLVVAVTRLPEG
jgi:regulator of ribonuclease activity A